jgi:transcriptional regulator with GAF, ATPase, and Fis domain/serine/threonine protein kinase
MEVWQMGFSEDKIKKAKSITVIKQSQQATTSLLVSSEGNKYIIKQFKQGFSNEARSEYLFLQAVKSENVIKAIDLLPSETPVLVLEYVPGDTLTKTSFKNWNDFEMCFARLAFSISQVHSYGICLNDIKPDNLILNQGRAVIVDFGMATVNLFFERNFRGTPAFAAPEKFIRHTNHFASDIFSLGMTFFYSKHGKTIMDITGDEEYQKIICKEESWQKQLDILESDTLIRSMLNYNPALRPNAVEIATLLADKHKLKLAALDRVSIECHVFKTQTKAVEKLWKKKNLNCDYADEPQQMENLLSLWSETNGRKLLILDESVFVSQPEDFFKSFPFGYREKNIYQPRFIEWLNEQPITVLLRRNKLLTPTSFFDEIRHRTDALQLWIGNESEVKAIAISEINDILLRIPSLEKNKAEIRKRIQTAKPFHIRLILLEFLKEKKNELQNNELADFLAWFKISFPLLLVEKIWDNWYILVQDGLLNRRIILESNVVRTETKTNIRETPSPELVEKVINYAVKAGFYHIAGEAHFQMNDIDKALDNWGLYIEELTKGEYFLSAFEFIQLLKKRIKTFPFELKKKEAFLARICGHFELSNHLYKDLISESDGLLKAILSVDQAIVLQALKHNEDAINSYKNAIELFRIHKDLKSQFRAMNNLGVVYFGLQRYTDAEQLFNDVLSEAKLNNNIQFETISYLNLSDIQLKRGEWKRVLYYTDKAISNARSNQKWNLYANGSIIQSRALFANGEYLKAIQILHDLKENPKIKENLLQYQETLAWLLHYVEVYDPEQTESILSQIEINTSSMHEILRRELFFVKHTRKQNLHAYNYLQELSEVVILKAFFDSDVETIIEKLKELNSYLYYLTHFMRIFPEYVSRAILEDVQEAINLYSYKPFAFLLNKKPLTDKLSIYWARLVQELNTHQNETQLIQAVLNSMQQLVKADKFVYLESKNGNLAPSHAIDESGTPLTNGQLLLSQKMLTVLSEKRGYFYLYPAFQFIDSDSRSSVLGLGISTVCGYALTNGNKLGGVFYCDSSDNLDFDESKHAVCRVLFHFAQTAIDKLNGNHDNKFYSEMTEPDGNELSKNSIVGNSKVMRDVHAKISLCAGYNVNVLIIGPTGSGKELVARDIHRQYIEKNQAHQKTPFVAVNCAAIPEQLLESELFGYKKGAFTGAVTDKKGKLQLADNGTIFLDEIGEMPVLLQSKLLRAIQEKVITPLGSDQDVPVNVRIIAASNQNLEEMIAQNQFRTDLYYRLKVMTIELPSLSERKDDIPLLVMAFIKKFNDKFHKCITGIHPGALDYLQSKEWKGNVRELENDIERAVLLCNKDYLGVDDFTSDSDSSAGSIFRNLPLQWNQFKIYKQRIEDELEKRYIRLLMEEAGNNIMNASKIGSLDRMQVYRLLKKKED